MVKQAIDITQRRAAITVGVAYLTAMALAVFADTYARGRIFVRGDAGKTAQNLLDQVPLLRMSITGHLLVSVTDVALIVALYVILKRVNQNLALAALMFRMIETAVLTVTSLNDFNGLSIITREGNLRTLGVPQADALGMLSSNAHNAGFQISFLFLGIGSTFFAYLWWKSRYIPVLIAGFGIISSALLAVGAVLFLAFPALFDLVFPTYMMPLGIFEVTMGVWLLAKGIRVPASAEA